MELKINCEYQENSQYGIDFCRYDQYCIFQLHGTTEGKNKEKVPCKVCGLEKMLNEYPKKPEKNNK